MTNSDSSQHYTELLKLSKEPSVDQGNIEEALNHITQSLARGLNASRASVWIFNADRSAIVCVSLFEAMTGTHSRGAELKAKDFPAYFNFLTEERTLAATDAHTHPATSEFSEVYLKPLNISSMLDAPIRLNGKLAGVICCEQVGGPREWSSIEQTFVGNMTDIVARAYQAKARAEAVIELENINANLENMIKVRTLELETALAKNAHSAKLATIGEMAGTIAHEINSPLNAILLRAEQIELALNEPHPDLSKILPSVSLITATSLHISKIVKGLLLFARGGGGEQSLVEIHDVLDQTLSLCLERIKSRGISFEFNRANTQFVISCDPAQIGQVILNLLNNSFDEVSNTPDSRISISTSTRGEHLVISVTDSGPTPDKEIQKNLFKPFFTTKRKSGGTGIGLNISKGIVEKHGGRIYLDATSPNTKFVVEIPLVSSGLAVA